MTGLCDTFTGIHVSWNLYIIKAAPFLFRDSLTSVL